MIDQTTIDRINETAQIQDVVNDFVTLKKRGVNMIGLCPFHNEKTPSFIVSPAKGIFKCFGCGKGGNSVNFIMEHEQITYTDGLKYLARKYHIPVSPNILIKYTKLRGRLTGLQIPATYANFSSPNHISGRTEDLLRLVADTLKFYSFKHEFHF